jgi:DNA-binding transcriptional LysR family regulator
MDIIDNLKTFIAVVETGNFTNAARHLKVAVSLVKKRIDHLESQVGVVLFERSTRRMTLTDAGRRHLLKTRAAVSQVDLLLAQMGSRPQRLEGRLRVKAPTCMLGAYLSDVLNRFQERHPGISLEVLAIDRPVNPIEEGFDVSIVLLPITWPGVANLELATMKRHVVASPSYLAKRGRPRVPGDLVNHDLLHLQVPGMVWIFQSQTGPIEIKVSPMLMSNNAHHLMSAAGLGNGLCLISDYTSMPFIQSGQLVTVLDDYPVSEMWARMHIPEERLELTHVQALRNHLQESIGSNDLQQKG